MIHPVYVFNWFSLFLLIDAQLLRESFMYFSRKIDVLASSTHRAVRHSHFLKNVVMNEYTWLHALISYVLLSISENSNIK